MPNRILKESICTSDNLNELSEEAENFFYRLLVCCDDFGRFDGRPAIIKSRCFPLKEKSTDQITSYLQMLQNNGIIKVYVVDGKSYIQMQTWDKHQQVRAKKSKFPAPDCDLLSFDINCNPLLEDVPVIQSNPIQSESESNTITAIPYTDILDAYNKFCPSLCKAHEVNSTRHMLIKAAFEKYEKHDGGALKVFDAVFKKAERSNFLKGMVAGRDGKTFRAKFDWIFSLDKMAKILEGDYDNASDPLETKTTNDPFAAAMKGVRF